MKRDAYDLIVIGAGAAGLTAASTAAAFGRRVLVPEHTGRIGGTTATEPVARVERGARNPGSDASSPDLRGAPRAGYE